MIAIERESDQRETLARAVRVMARLGHFDPFCHASVRTSDGILITPDFDSRGTPSPRSITGDLLVMIKAGQDSPAVPERTLRLHRALYEARDDIGAALFVYPPTAMAALGARHSPRKITHAEAWMVETVAPYVDIEAFVEAPTEVAGVLEPHHRIIPIVGTGIVFLASDIDVAISNVYSYEYLARMNLLASSLPRDARETTPEEIHTIQAERATPETVGSVDSGAFLRSFDEDAMPRVAVEDGSVNARVALSCRILAYHRTLVGFYEHVSHRLEGEAAFAMSPAKNFSQIRASDILVVGLDAEATWISGTHPPAPFRRFHRDIFLARPDVMAIVHTHEMYGRVFMAAGEDLAVLDRHGVGHPPTPPRLGRASMVFETPDRRDAVNALGSESVYHTDFHGTDYVASTIEEATVTAVHREVAYRTFHSAVRLGEPVPLTTPQMRALARIKPGVDAWWRFYSDMLVDACLP